ncbi:MAG: DASH family cryptochrome [Flavobacteriales bacterium]
MSVSRNLFWLRRDLRLSDQSGLQTAISESDCLFYHSEYQFHSFFSPLPPSRYRRDFINQALAEMEIGLGELGCKIHKSTLNPISDIPMICHKENIRMVCCNQGFSWFERWQEAELKKRLEPLGVSLNVVNAERFPWMPESQLNPKSIFTDYRQKMESLLATGIAATPESQITEQNKAMGDVDSTLSHPTNAIIGGESQAQRRLHNYVSKNGGIVNYVETRNGMLGHEYSSMLSPYLAAGCCSAAQVYEAVKVFESAYGATKSSYWLVFELLWRSYFKWIGEMHGYRLYITPGYKGKRGWVGRKDKQRFLQWVKGETREPIVNACMRELAHTGFMGNRGRQIAASYLIHDLEVEWTWGARYFEHMLIDYDACSNYGNWAYLAGVGSDPRPSRRFNTTLQQEKYDPERLYVNHWMGWNAIPLEEEIFERITS